MIRISTVINTFKQGFLKQYKNTVLPSHQQALSAMEACRQAHGPHMLAQCTDPDCGQRKYIPHSCGHRNCPHCQNHESQQWIENQLSKHLPTEYYLITFTLPSQLRYLAWAHQKRVYSLMFDCVQDTLKTFTRNDKKLGGEPGLTAMLHTHSRELEYHPHIHVVMPAASIDKTTGLWKKKTGYLFNERALAKVFR
ncbi:MAG: IS91 family transposase, partial [Desulfobacterales bacterium]